MAETPTRDQIHTAREQLDAQAYEYGRSLAAELRGAAQISMVVRTIYLLRHDSETSRRLGAQVAVRRQCAEKALDALCSKLFGPDIAVEVLLSEAPIGVGHDRESVP